MQNILTGCWGALTLHWGEEQSPNWRKSRGDAGDRNMTPAITFHPFPTYFSLRLSVPPQNSLSSAGAAPLPQPAVTSPAAPGQCKGRTGATISAPQDKPQPYPEPMTQGLRALCIKDQNHTELPRNAGVECILNTPISWVNADRGANQAQRKEHPRHQPLLILPQ